MSRLFLNFRFGLVEIVVWLRRPTRPATIQFLLVAVIAIGLELEYNAAHGSLWNSGVWTLACESPIACGVSQ